MERERRNQINIQAERFKKIRRKLSAMGRVGEQPKPELTKEFVSLDEWLTQNTPFWRSHFGFKRDEEI